jgi:hypothetical protein
MTLSKGSIARLLLPDTFRITLYRKIYVSADWAFEKGVLKRGLT